MVKTRTLLISFFVVLIFPVFANAQPISSTSIYVNEDIGVRVAFENGWQVFSSRKQAPAVLKANFPENKGPDDSPLFIGMHGNQQLFSRLLVEPFFADLESFADFMVQGFAAQGLEVISAKMTIDSTAMEMEYIYPLLGLRFRERISLLEDSLIIRMAVWTGSTVFDGFLPQMDAVFDDAELSAVRNAEDGWQPVWAALDERLSDTNITGIEIIELEPSVVIALDCEDPSSSMLWKVEGTGRDVFLFGSIHVGKPEFYPLHDTIETAFREADHLVFEVDPQTAADPVILLEIQTRGMLPTDVTLTDVVSPAIVENLRRVMRGMGLPADNFMTLQPWFLTLMLTGLQMNSRGYVPQYGIESYLLSQKPNNTDVLELETIMEQIAYLEELNAETFLDYTLQSFEDGGQEVEELISAWLCSDKDSLEEILFGDFSEDPTAMADMAMLREKLFFERNIRMAAGVEDYLENGSGDYFIVVGAGHLLGERSVIDVLQNAGYQIRPVILSP